MFDEIDKITQKFYKDSEEFIAKMKKNQELLESLNNKVSEIQDDIDTIKMEIGAWKAQSDLSQVLWWYTLVADTCE